MPLYKKQPFVPEPIPENIEPDEMIFFHKLTNEIFTNYDAYFDRSIMCSSMVWSCAVTGKRQLTFQEALDSEARIRKPRKKKIPGDETNNNIGNSSNNNNSTNKDQSSANSEPNSGNNNTATPKTKSSKRPKSASEPGSEDCKPAKKKYKYDPKKYNMPIPDGFDPELLTKTGKIDGRKLKSKKNAELAHQLLESKKQNPVDNTPKKPGPKPGFKKKKKSEEVTVAAPTITSKASKAKSIASQALKREREVKRKKEAVLLARQRERQRKEDEKKEMAAFLQDWEKKCEDLQRDDLRVLPIPVPVDCDIPAELFGDAIYIMEILNNFHEVFDIKSACPNGLDFDILEEILLDRTDEGALSDLVQFLLKTILKLQHTSEGLGDESHAKPATDASTAEHVTESKEICKTESTANKTGNADDKSQEDDLDLNGTRVNGEIDADDDENKEADMIASAIKAAQAVHNSLTTPLTDIEITPYNVTEVLRLHFLQSGIFPRSRSVYNGWYSAREDPGLWLCIQEPDLIKKLSEATIFDLSMEERIKILHALINQMLNFVKTRTYIESANEKLVELRKEYRAQLAAFARWERDNLVKKMQPPKKRADVVQLPLVNVEMNEQLCQSGPNSDEIESLSRETLSCDTESEVDSKHSLSNGTSKSSDSAKKDSKCNGKSKKSLSKPLINGKVNAANCETDTTAQIKKQCNNAIVSLDSKMIEDKSVEELAAELLPSIEEREKLRVEKEDADERAYQENQLAYEHYQQERSRRLAEHHAEILTLKTNIRNVQSLYGMHPIGRDRAYRRFWLFQSLPGIFVEANDPYVGPCLADPTPTESRFKTKFNRENPIELSERQPIEGINNNQVGTASKIAESNNKNSIDLKTNNRDKNGHAPGSSAPDFKTPGEPKAEDTVDNKHNSGNTREKSSSDNTDSEEINRCLGHEDQCYIHGKRRSDWQPRWWFFYTPESVEQLIGSLNKRGVRESDLLDTLNTERETIIEWVTKCPAVKLNQQLAEQCGIRRSRRLRQMSYKKRSRFTASGAYQNV